MYVFVYYCWNFKYYRELELFWGEGTRRISDKVTGRLGTLLYSVRDGNALVP